MKRLIERLTKVAKRAGTAARVPETKVAAELGALRARVPQLTGSLVASADGLLIAQDLPRPSNRPGWRR